MSEVLFYHRQRKKTKTTDHISSPSPARVLHQATYMICSDIGDMLFGADKPGAAARIGQRGASSVPAGAGLTVAA